MIRPTNMGACRRVARRAAPNDTEHPTDSSHYSPPKLPARKVLADMVMFYATAELRERMMSEWPEDAGLIEELVEQVIELAATWRPSTQWHHDSVIRPYRTLEWMVWQVTVSADEDWGPLFRHDAIVPFAIDLDTLPRYPVQPTRLVHPDDAD